MHIFVTMFEKEIKEYERVREVYQKKVAERMNQRDWMEYNEILFSAHSCAIEGNSFTVDDTRILHEQGMAMVPVGRSLLECAEMADHFRAYDYVVSHLNHPFDETLLKEVNRLVTEHTFVFEADSRGRNHEYLVAFFFRVAISRMNDELLQKERNSRHTFLF